MRNERLFLWRNPEGKKGELVAHSRDHARYLLMSQGVRAAKVTREIKLRKSRWRTNELAPVVRQMATLLQAGLPLVNSLELIAAEHPNPVWRYVLRATKDRVVQGASLSEAMGEHLNAFPALFIELIATGEMTGRLEQCCQLLANRLEKQQMLNHKVRKALRYPLFILSAALLVTLLMLAFVLPAFKEIYDTFDAPLPTFTLAILLISDAVQRYGAGILLFTGSLAAYYFKRLHHKEKWRRREQRLWLRLPLVGKLVEANILALLFRSLAITQQAGLSLMRGIQSSANACGDLQYADAMLQVLNQVERGSSLFNAFRQLPLFPSLTIQLIRAGEESGTLDLMLERLAAVYESEAENMAEGLASRIEPVLMGVLGILVGGMTIAIYLPIFQLGNVMG
ncbi:protein transport protein HofC [Leminorella grimontii]|uniref:protein transport protein HofC n=1 Tax=Leminorella grimontii TaxID=82981 RepID=UPI00207DA0EB|nr:protein transport protein HofC [Leminorella grimontii]GKX60477.1 type II secretion protein F [Leminorella grimontii]